MNNLEEFIKKYEAKFVSFKYVDMQGRLKQIDIAAKNLVLSNDYVIVNNIKLLPIKNKCFFDPFRSSPTIFCLCENLNNDWCSRLFAENFVTENRFLENIDLEMTINFSIIDEREVSLKSDRKIVNYQNQVEPYDKFANLRSEIVEILEKIGISTNFHNHASEFSSCSIGIKAKNLLDMSDNWLIANFIIANIAESYGKLAYFSKKLPNILFVLFSGLEYNEKEFAILFISRIVRNLENCFNNELFVERFIENNELERAIDTISAVSNRQNYHGMIKNCHSDRFELHQETNPYITMTYLMATGFDIKLSNVFFDNLKKHFISVQNLIKN